MPQASIEFHAFAFISMRSHEVVKVDANA